MARIRTIKPDFFTHECLAELSPLTRLFFIGLWTQADREGRLEDRPKRLKAVILPYDDCEVVSILDDLASAGFLIRYEADGKHFLQIPAFGKHQRPHPKEPTSEIPAQPSREKKRQAVKKNGETMVNPSLREGKGREGKGRSNTSHPADEWPSSSALFDLYNSRSPDECPAVETHSPARIKKCKQYLALFPQKEWWEECFKEIHLSPFLRGLVSSNGHEKFRCTLDWLLSKGKNGTENCVKVQEGFYRR